MNNKETLPTRSIVVVGDENEFFADLNEKFQEKDGRFFQYNFSYFSLGVIGELIETQDIDCVIIDFTLKSFEDCFDDLFFSILNLRNSEKFCKVPLIGIIERPSFWENNLSLINIGLNYFHILGDDENLFFGNLYYILYEDASYLLKLARSIKLNINEEGHFAGNLNFLDELTMNIDCDFEVGEDEICSFTGDYNGYSVKLSSTKLVNGGVNYPSMYTYDTELEFSETSSWGEAEDKEDGNLKLMSSDEYLTRIQNKVQDKKYKKSPLISVYSVGLDFQNNFQLRQSSFLNGFFYRSQDKYRYTDGHPELKPNMVIYNCKNDEMIDQLDDLFENFDPGEKFCIFLILNHPSKAAALRKVYNYENIIVYNSKINIQEIESMVDLVCKNHSQDEEFSLAYIKYDTVLIRFGIQITSLSENEITFKTNKEIPYYTNIVLKSDEKMIILTIVPAHLNLSPNINGYHYMGIINGVTEADRQFFRRQVRLLLKSDPRNIEQNPFLYEVEEDRNVDVNELDKADSNRNELEHEEKNNISNEVDTKKDTYKGRLKSSKFKSKL